MATELQRIPAKGVKFEAFTRQQLGMLQCPIYSAALARDIRPETDFLRDKLKDLGVSVLAQGYEWLRFAKRITSSPKYTEYTKLAALEIAEGSLARDLYAVESKHPGTVAAGVCASGLPTSQLKPVQTAIGTYIAHFTPSDPGRNTAVNASCPGNPDRIELARVRDLTNMIKDVKIAQAKLIESSGGVKELSSPAGASALAVLMNAGSSKEATALIDLGDSLLKIHPETAAGAYAKSFDIKPTVRAKGGFANALSESPNLQATIKSSPSTYGSSNAISSFPPIDQQLIGDLITEAPGLKPGSM